MEQALKALKPTAAGNINSITSDNAHAAAIALISALAETELVQEHKPVATVKSWTNGSYWRNYKIDWHADVEEGTLLYAGQPAPQQQTVPAPVKETSTCGRCVVFCQGGDGCLGGMPQITQIERERLVCGQLSRRTPPADVPMLTEILHAIDDAAVLADFAECWIKDPSIEGMHRLKNGGVKFRLLAQAARQKAGLA